MSVSPMFCWSLYSSPDGTVFVVVVCEVLKWDDVTGVNIQSYTDHYFIQDDLCHQFPVVDSINY